MVFHRHMRRREWPVTVGQVIDSPSGRVARAQEIDAAWQNLWTDQATHHVDAALREAFETDYRAWQQAKETLGAMSAVALILPATGELLDRWTQKARDWHTRFGAFGVQPTAPRIQEPTPAPAVNRAIWGVAAIVGGLCGLYALSKLPSARRVAA